MSRSVASFAAVCFLLTACTPESGLVGYNRDAAPVLRLDNPTPAAWLATGSTEVFGTAEHLEALTVNGIAAQRKGTSFSSQLDLPRGISMVEASGTDFRGDVHFVRHGVIAGTFAEAAGAVEDGVRIRVNQGGLDRVLDAVADQLIASEIEAMAFAANPVYSDAYGIAGWDAVTVNADIIRVSFSPVRGAADPTPGQLAIEVTIPNLELGVKGYGDVVGWNYDTDVWFWTDRAVITGMVEVKAEGGRLVADLPAAQVQLAGFGWDTSLLPGDLETYLFVDAVRGFIEDQLADAMIAQVPPLLEEQLAGLDLSYETELLDRPVSVRADFAAATIDEDGLEVVLDLDVAIPGSGAHEDAGYLVAEGGPAQLSTIPDIALGLHDDLLNRVLFEAWRAGMLEMTMSTEDGSLSPLMLMQLHAEEGTVAVRADLPPVIVEKAGGLQAQVGELIVDIHTPGGEMGENLQLALNVGIDLVPTITDGVLTLELADPIAEMVVRSSDWGASNEATTALMEEALPLDALLILLGDIEVPLPELGGITIDRAITHRDASGAHTGVYVELR